MNLFDMLFEAASAWNQIAFMFGGLICLLIGGGLIGWFAYGHITGTKIKGRIAGVRMTGGGDRVAASVPLQQPENTEDFGTAFRKSPGTGIMAVFFVLLVLGVPLTFVGFGAWFAADYLDLAKNGVEIHTAVIDNVYSHDSDGGGTYHAVVAITDSNGQTYRAKDRISVGSSPSLPTGSDVVVHYDPSNPSHAVMGSFWHNMLLPVVFCGIGALVLLLIFNLPRLKNRAARTASGRMKTSYAGEMYYPVFEYQDRSGKLIRVNCDTGSNWISDKIPGTPIWLYVSPDNPEKAMPSGIILPVVGAFFAVPGVVLIYVALTSFKFNIFTIIFPLLLFAHYGWKLKKKLTPEKMAEAKAQFLARKASKTSPSGRELTADEIRTRVRAMQKTSGVVAPFLALAAAGLIALGLHLGQGMNELMARGQRVQGEVVRMESVHSSSNGGGYTYYPVVGFDAPAGGHHEFRDKVGTNPPSRSTGDKVTVLYDPGSPDKAVIDRGAWNWTASGGCILGGALLLLIALKSLMNARRGSRL